MNKLFFCIVMMLSFSTGALAQDKVLLIEATRVIGDATSGSRELQTEKAFHAIVLNPKFTSQFQEMNNEGVSSKLLYCGLIAGEMKYSQFFSVTAAGKVATWGWGSGQQVVADQTIKSSNGIVTATSKFADWNSVDSSYESSFTNKFASVNIMFTSRVIPVDQLEAIKGDSKDLKINCDITSY